MKSTKKVCLSLLLSIMVVVSFYGIAIAEGNAVEKVYTTTTDFDEGTSVNISNEISDQLQLDDTTKPFGFIWIAVSSKGTVVKINTETGKVLGEYYTSPSGQPKNPSRTTVDKNEVFGFLIEMETV